MNAVMLPLVSAGGWIPREKILICINPQSTKGSESAASNATDRK
jgi:hypothetical protein